MEFNRCLGAKLAAGGRGPHARRTTRLQPDKFNLKEVVTWDINQTSLAIVATSFEEIVRRVYGGQTTGVLTWEASLAVGQDTARPGKHD